MEIAEERGKLLVATLSIHESLERHSLCVSLWGSSDGADFGTQPLACFRARQYSGIHSTLLNLAGKPEVNFLRVQWQVARQRKITHMPPLFSFQVFLEESGARLQPAVSLRPLTHSVGAAKWSQSQGHAA